MTFEYPELAVRVAIDTIRETCELQPQPWRWDRTHEGRQITILRAFMSELSDVERWDVWCEVFPKHTHLLHEDPYALELFMAKRMAPFFRSLEPLVNKMEVAA